MKQFAERLRQLRKQKKLTLKALGQALGVSDAFVSMLETQKRQPSRELIQQLAQVLSPDKPELLRDELLILAGFSPQNLEAFQIPSDPLEAYRQQLQAAPGDFSLFQGYLQTLLKTERFAEAQQLAEAGLSRFKDAYQLQALLSHLEVARHNFAAALQAQQAALALYRAQTESAGKQTEAQEIEALLIANLGGIYFQMAMASLGQDRQQAQAQFEQAQQYFAQALEKQPDNAFTRDEYARVCFNLADLLPEANTLWQASIFAFEATFASPQIRYFSPEARLESSLFWAYAHSKMGQPEQALKLLQVLGLFHDRHWLLHYLKACVHLQAFQQTADPSQLAAARQAYQQALSCDAASASAQAAHDPDLLPLQHHHPELFA